MSKDPHKYSATKRTFWTVAIFYLLIAFEFFYMASPFAVYFYSVYGPGLNFINHSPTLAWLSSSFLPHIVLETSSVLLNLRNLFGAVLAVASFLAFCIGAGQVYYYKITRRGAVTGGIYNLIRHPQYISLALCSFGLLLLWPRYIVLLSFNAMLFAYYFLARAEERECEEKYGKTYIEYKNKTAMFFPFRIPVLEKLSSLSETGLKRYVTILATYVALSLAAIGLANGLRSWSLNSLYSLESNDAVYISVTRVEKDTLEHIVKTVLANSKVKNILESSGGGANSKFINYVLPVELYISEIPMNSVDGTGGHHFLPKEYDKNSHKIIFTKAELRSNSDKGGKDILLNTIKIVPVVEVWIDLSRNQVVEIKSPPAKIQYENIPVPLY